MNIISIDIPIVVIAAIIGSLTALVTAFLAALTHTKIGLAKLKNDNSLKFVDEWFSAEFSNRRSDLSIYLNKNPPSKFTDLFVKEAHILLAFRSTINFLERLHGVMHADRLDKAIITETLGPRLSYWYVFLIEGPREETDEHWKSNIKRLESIIKLCKKDDLLLSRKELSFRRQIYGLNIKSDDD